MARHIRDTLHTRTRTASSLANAATVVQVPVLTLLWHPDVSRVGERAWLPDLEDGRAMLVSRLEPEFSSPDGRGQPRPLAELTVSRKPLRLSPEPEGIQLSLGTCSQPVEVDGTPLEDRRLMSAAELTRGVVLRLGGRVVLSLQRRSPESLRPPAFGLVGESWQMLRVRRQIQAVADLDVHVLIRGESGTGKELVAQAIREHSQRRTAPFYTINMAAVPASLAASELFGAAKGAFSGADRSRPGYFGQAQGGTLFLDEVGETPQEVQGLLLRALESGEIQPVGAGRVRQVDVRVLAATDADLDEQVSAGHFAQALLQRLRGFEIRIPPLRERLEDFGRLFLHFLRAELHTLGRDEVLDYAGALAHPFVSAHIVARMALHDWPGNVRELRNEVRQLVVASREAERLDAGGWLESPAESTPGLSESPPSAPPNRPARLPRKPARGAYRDPSDLQDEEMLEALAENDWNVKAAAETLGISRGSLYVRISDHPKVRKAIDLDAAEIEAALIRCDYRLVATARFLRVSKQGLKRQMSRLELSARPQE